MQAVGERRRKLPGAAQLSSPVVVMMPKFTFGLRGGVTPIN
jgi:hypothetical protein